MVSPELVPQLQFLTDAAHLLSASSPETSAFLMSRRTSLLVDYGVPVTDHQRQRVCSCCGHIMIPGQGSELTIGADRAMKSRVRKQPRPSVASAATALAGASPQKPGTSKVSTCASCSRYTRLQLPAPQPLKTRGRRRRADQQRAPQDRRQAASTEPARLSANASSKKRAKNRKAGLQALLDQRSGQGSGASSGLGLSLADFMKK